MTFAKHALLFLGLMALAPASAQAQSLWRSGARMGYLITDRTARRVGDTITIVISEQQAISDKNNTKIERTSSNVSTVNAFQLTTHSPIALPGIDISGSRKLDAKADAQITGSFSTTITGTVLDVQPNGNLIVLGRRRIFVDQQEKTIEITGVIRPWDISPMNSVNSSQIAEARITFIGEGPIAEAAKKGWLARGWDKFWNTFWPF